MNAERHTIRARAARFSGMVDEIAAALDLDHEARIYVRLTLMHLANRDWRIVRARRRRWPFRHTLTVTDEL